MITAREGKQKSQGTPLRARRCQNKRVVLQGSSSQLLTPQHSADTALVASCIVTPCSPGGRRSGTPLAAPLPQSSVPEPRKPRGDLRPRLWHGSNQDPTIRGPPSLCTFSSPPKCARRPQQGLGTSLGTGPSGPAATLPAACGPGEALGEPLHLSTGDVSGCTSSGGSSHRPCCATRAAPALPSPALVGSTAQRRQSPSGSAPRGHTLRAPAALWGHSPRGKALPRQCCSSGTSVRPCCCFPHAPLLAPGLPKQNGVFGFCFGVATLTCDRADERKNEG